MAHRYKILILCTGNSARSIIAEYLLRAKGRGRFETYSAGAQPTGVVNPLAIRVLQDRYSIDAADARSKSWSEFKDTIFDLVITVCDNARESCPVWPGQPIVAHWSSPDPAAATGGDQERRDAFTAVAAQIADRIDRLCSLPDEKIDAPTIQRIAEELP